MRVKYLKELNQLWLFKTGVLKEFLKNYEFGVGEVVGAISKYVSGVELRDVDGLSEGEGVVLGSFFTDVSGFCRRDYGMNLVVFPIYDEDVSYNFKSKGRCLVDVERGLKMIFSDDFFDFSKKGSFSFFEGNLFRSKEYVFVRRSFLQSGKDIENTCCSREKIVQKVACAGVGFLDVFV